MIALGTNDGVSWSSVAIRSIVFAVESKMMSEFKSSLSEDTLPKVTVDPNVFAH